MLQKVARCGLHLLPLARVSCRGRIIFPAQLELGRGLPKPGSRAAALDVLATDADGQKFNIEAQLDPRGASEKRARFYASLIDSKALQPGQEFGELPEVWVIFITESDVPGGGKPLYHFERCIKGSETALHDGSHILYVNGANREAGTALGDLMHDFFCRDVAHMRLAQLAQAVQRYKTSEQRAREMSSVLDEIREEIWAEALTEGREEGREEGRLEGSRDIARQLLRMEGFTPEIVARITNLGIDEVQHLGAEGQGA